MITVKVVGTTPDMFIKIVDEAILNINSGMDSVANEARFKMVNIIEQNKKREGSSGRLENSIQVDRLSDNHYGVGNTDFMSQPEVAPHWHIINYGGMVSEKARRVPGFFGNDSPPNPAMRGTGGGTEAFTYAPYSYMMHVKSPIAGINYIEKTKDWLMSVMGDKFRGWTKRYSVSQLGTDAFHVRKRAWGGKTVIFSKYAGFK